MNKVRLINNLCPGDVLVMTAAIESLHEQYPEVYEVAVKSFSPDIFENNPRVVPHDNSFRDIEMRYPLINQSNQWPVNFLQGYTDHLGEQLGIRLKITTKRPHLYLSDGEMSWMSQVQEFTGKKVKYWVINAGTKQDYTAKGWGHENYQEVVNMLYGRVQFVQIGENSHMHKPLEKAINFIGKTNLRQLIRLCWNAEGGVGPITFIQHVFAAYEKPYVALLGGREPLMWEHYHTQTTLSTLGSLPCCRFGACWCSRVVPLGDDDEKDKRLCELPVFGAEETIPKCMAMIEPSDVVRAILRYYEGGVLSY